MNEAEVTVSSFQGMVSNVDPHDVEPGQSVSQVNVLSHRQGELVLRGGIREATYDSE